MQLRPAAAAAFAASLSHLLAGLAMALVLRPGLGAPGVTLAARMEWLPDHRLTWSVGWLCWHAAGVCMMAFYVGLALRWFQAGPLRTGLALVLAAAALANDLGGQSLYLMLPEVGPDAFVLLDRSATLLTANVANGLYSLAGALLVWVGARELPRPLLLLSLGVWLPGSLMCLAAVAGSAVGLVVANVLLMPTLVVWTALVGRWLQRADPAIRSALR
jgi:hypothetical protein